MSLVRSSRSLRLMPRLKTAREKARRMGVIWQATEFAG
jgi:hypothetical protein